MIRAPAPTWRQAGGASPRPARPRRRGAGFGTLPTRAARRSWRQGRAGLPAAAASPGRRRRIAGRGAEVCQGRRVASVWVLARGEEGWWGPDGVGVPCRPARAPAARSARRRRPGGGQAGDERRGAGGTRPSRARRSRRRTPPIGAVGHEQGGGSDGAPGARRAPERPAAEVAVDDQTSSRRRECAADRAEVPRISGSRGSGQHPVVRAERRSVASLMVEVERDPRSRHYGGVEGPGDERRPATGRSG